MSFVVLFFYGAGIIAVRTAIVISLLFDVDGVIGLRTAFDLFNTNEAGAIDVRTAFVSFNADVDVFGVQYALPLILILKTLIVILKQDALRHRHHCQFHVCIDRIHEMISGIVPSPPSMLFSYHQYNSY